MFQKLKQFLFVPSREFVATAPIHYVLKSLSSWNLLGWKPLATVLYASPQLRAGWTKLDVNERIIEVPWVYSQLNFKKKGKVLDIGWLESTLPISLATAGFSVTGLDIRSGELTHPNFEGLVGDICETKLPSNSFDYVILLSTLEHIGLNTLYGRAASGSSDKKAVEQCLRVLKLSGKLLITTPVAKQAAVNDFMRIYTPAILKRLVRNGAIESLEFFKANQNRTAWSVTSENDLPTPPDFGVALVVVKKGQ
ncbi:MAG: hypothetical protein COY81_02535 [Candidatus Pacebacteria bacterium CG_4_10_14_0_8_um_filter_43_12]|nr:MAG: hypothetical protein COU66_00065 [Candidatus Pacebacteria bacterium CG10_big_fil_rev_8_21_14_0_10_44_11]PIY79418.1 MAG: hypothetical protein COY81_02535 [Candidatus Pacebacteria bacterium CG_4_10_14_0_8_um_filter_43_12]